MQCLRANGYTYFKHTVETQTSMSYLASRIHFLSLLDIKCQKDPMEPKQWKQIKSKNPKILLMPLEHKDLKINSDDISHTRVKAETFPVSPFSKRPLMQKLILLFTFFSFFFFSLVKYVCVWGSGKFQTHRCLRLHTGSLLGTINGVESKVIQSSTSHFWKLLFSVKGVIKSKRQRLPPAHANSLILMQLSYWSKQSNLSVQLALCLIKNYLTRLVVKEYCICPQIQFGIL